MTYLTYTKNGNDIIIYMGSDTTTGKSSRNYRSQPEEVMLTLEWSNGQTQNLYSNNFSVNDIQ